MLPSYVVRIRHYGFLANCVREEKQSLCRSLLGVDAASEPLPAPEEPVEGQTTADLCPSCGKGRMVIVETLRLTPTRPRVELLSPPALEQVGFDTS